MITIGIDPGLNRSGVALFDGKELKKVWAVKVPAKSRKGENFPASTMLGAMCIFLQEVTTYRPDRIVVEGQQIYTHSKAADHDLINLAHCAGGIAGMAIHHFGRSGVLVPTPKEWKGGVPKNVHQARTYTKMGWHFDQTSKYSWPVAGTDFGSVSGARELKQADWQEVGDAIGLGLWAGGS